jgi:hypothetical protein
MMLWPRVLVKHMLKLLSVDTNDCEHEKGDMIFELDQTKTCREVAIMILIERPVSFVAVIICVPQILMM